MGKRIEDTKVESVAYITLDMGGAAFADGNAGAEVARILRRLATDWAEDGIGDVTLRDRNGNRCGRAEVREEVEG